MCSLSVMHPIDSMQCIGETIVSKVGGAVSSAFSNIFGGIVKWLTGLIVDAVAWMLKTLGTFWVNVSTPNVGDSNNVPSDTIGWMWQHLGFYTVLLLVLSILLGAGRMMITRKAEPGVDLVRSVGTYVLVSSMGLAVTSALIAAADAFSPWIIEQATGQDFTTGIGNMLNFAAATGTGAVAFIVIIIIGLLSVLASVIQVVLMVMRSAMLILLTSVQPLAAAATNTEMGKQWFKKLVAWTLAFILYKPVASIVYALAFRLMTGASTATGGGMVGLIMGLSMLVMSLLALPALMRFLVPAVAAVSGGSGAGAMAAGAIATGAMVVATGGAGAAAGGGGAAASKGAGASGAPASSPGRDAGGASGGNDGGPTGGSPMGGGGPASDPSGGLPAGGGSVEAAISGADAAFNTSGSGAAADSSAPSSGGSKAPAGGAGASKPMQLSPASAGTGGDSKDGGSVAVAAPPSRGRVGSAVASSRTRRASAAAVSTVGQRAHRAGRFVEDADNGPSGS